MRKSTAHHATVHFTEHPRASVNLQFEGTPKIGEAQGADIDIDIRPGSALARSIRETGKLLAAEAARQHKVDVALHAGKPVVEGGAQKKTRTPKPSVATTQAPEE